MTLEIGHLVRTKAKSSNKLYEQFTTNRVGGKQCAVSTQERGTNLSSPSEYCCPGKHPFSINWFMETIQQEVQRFGEHGGMIG